MSQAVIEAAARRPELASRIEHFRTIFNACAVERIGLALDNGIDWIAADLAALTDKRVVVPLAPFFSRTQLRHALDSSDCQIVLGDTAAGIRPDWLPERFQHEPMETDCELWLDRERPLRELAAGTFKISFTSGTTGTPKGICLSGALLEQVALALLERTAALDLHRHLCLLPLAVLLENIAGAWAAILGGQDLIVPGLHECGLSGSGGLDPVRWARCLGEHRPHSIIVLPQMLKLLHGLVAAGRYDPAGLRFVAVGGARTPATLIQSARELGLPVHEGYGMTECGSVVCLNAPGQDRIGSVGKPLRHQRLSVNARGELRIHGPHHLGELGGDHSKSAPLDTHDLGPLDTHDLGRIDDDGFVHLRGRTGNAYSTAWGRNVSPEWVEAELDAQPEILQSFVHGRELPSNLALIVPSGIGDINEAIERANAGLPDYARISAWCLRPQPFGTADGTATSNGRLRRARLLQLHGPDLETLAASQAGLATSFALEQGGHDLMNDIKLYQQLLQHSESGRRQLLDQRLIQRALAGEIDRQTYLAFLHEAYHHVRHTVPLLMACGARLPDRLDWLRSAVAEYIEEEIGHERWILDDIAAAGGDPEATRTGCPCAATELMVAYAYHIIDRGNPVGFFGMVHVLEGTSVALADRAADGLAAGLGLPATALRYLRSHGSLDQQHVRFFEDLVNRLSEAEDHRALLHAADRFYGLYGAIFASIEQTRLEQAA